MKLTYFIYLQLTIRRLIKHFTVIYADANKQFLTLNLIFLAAKKSPYLGPQSPYQKWQISLFEPKKISHVWGQGEVCRQLKIFYPLSPHPVVYTTDHSKAVVPVLFLFCVALWFMLQCASCFEVFPCSLSSCFVIPFSTVITSAAEVGAGLCASRAFVCLFCTC